jgi:ATP-dependent DNA helicase RecG
MEQLSISFPNNDPLFLLSPDEIYDMADQTLLFLLKEDRRIERKPARTHEKQLGEYHSMWANTAPDGGLLVLGMEDDGSFSGCSKLSPRELNGKEKASNTFCPECRTISKRIKVINIEGHEDFIILFRTNYQENKVICDVSGNAYIRIGDEKHKLTSDEIHELKIDKGQVDLEQEPTTLQYPDDFRDDLIRNFIEGLQRRRNFSRMHSTLELLQQRKLGRIEDSFFIPNKACVLLFAKEPNVIFPGCSIRFLRYEGEVEGTGRDYNVIKDIWLEGCIPELILDAARILESQLREFSRLGDDGKFYSAPEYPREAWYEAIVNACVHRSYSLRNMNIFVKMFDDRLVIESPGGFPPLVTPDNIYTSHHPRNPHLMNAMFYLDFVKCHNEGTRRMRDTMKEMNLPLPEFKQKEVASGNTSVRVTLRNNRKQRKVWIDSDVFHLLPRETAITLTKDETRVVNFIGENGKINVSEGQRLLPHIKTWHSVKKLLMSLCSRDILHHVSRYERDPDAHFILRTKMDNDK